MGPGGGQARGRPGVARSYCRRVLNPGFSADADRAYGSTYVVPVELADQIVNSNSEFATGPEWRLQRVYGDELWARLKDLGLQGLPWQQLSVLDACCGTGFLSYHLLRRVTPRSLTLLDVSPSEVAEAERLIARGDATSTPVDVVCGDLAESALQATYDVVVGNSFLHHFPDVPGALRTIRETVRPGGLFVGLHEPTPAAVAWEAGGILTPAGLLLTRERWLRRMRYDGEGPVRPGTTDVWIFEADELRALLQDAGFVDVVVRARYLVRPYVVALLGLHLGPGKPRLSRGEQAALRAALRVDAALGRVLPSRWFGGLCFAARRPAPG